MAIFFLDECVPFESTSKTLSDAGHEVYAITDFIPAGSPDELVAAVANENYAILISHDKDFKTHASRRIDGQSPRYSNLCVVRMECKQPRIAERLQKSLSHIVLEYDERQHMKDKRLIINVKSDVLTVHR